MISILALYACYVLLSIAGDRGNARPIANRGDDHQNDETNHASSHLTLSTTNEIDALPVFHAADAQSLLRSRRARPFNVDNLQRNASLASSMPHSSRENTMWLATLHKMGTLQLGAVRSRWSEFVSQVCTHDKCLRLISAGADRLRRWRGDSVVIVQVREPLAAIASAFDWHVKFCHESGHDLIDHASRMMAAVDACIVRYGSAHESALYGDDIESDVRRRFLCAQEVAFGGVRVGLGFSAWNDTGERSQKEWTSVGLHTCGGCRAQLRAAVLDRDANLNGVNSQVCKFLRSLPVAKSLLAMSVFELYYEEGYSVFPRSVSQVRAENLMLIDFEVTNNVTLIDAAVREVERFAGLDNAAASLLRSCLLEALPHTASEHVSLQHFSKGARWQVLFDRIEREGGSVERLKEQLRWLGINIVNRMLGYASV